MKMSSVTARIMRPLIRLRHLLPRAVRGRSEKRLRNPQEAVARQRLAAASAAAADVHADRLAALQLIDCLAEVGDAVDFLALHFADDVALRDAGIAGGGDFLHAGDHDAVDVLAEAVELARLRRDLGDGDAEAVLGRAFGLALRFF